MFNVDTIQINNKLITKARVYGALLAQQSGRDVDIVNSFELPIPQDNKIDKQYLMTKQEQRRSCNKATFLRPWSSTKNDISVKQVFPDLDFMGWYTLGSFPTETDLKLHEQVTSKRNCNQSIFALTFALTVSRTERIVTFPSAGSCRIKQRQQRIPCNNLRIDDGYGSGSSSACFCKGFIQSGNRRSRTRRCRSRSKTQRKRWRCRSGQYT